MNLAWLLSDSVSIVSDLIKDVEAGISKTQGDGVLGNAMDVAEALLQDADFKAHLAKLVADIQS